MGSIKTSNNIPNKRDKWEKRRNVKTKRFPSQAQFCSPVGRKRDCLKMDGRRSTAKMGLHHRAELVKNVNDHCDEWHHAFASQWQEKTEWSAGSMTWHSLEEEKKMQKHKQQEQERKRLQNQKWSTGKESHPAAVWNVQRFYICRSWEIESQVCTTPHPDPLHCHCNAVTTRFEIAAPKVTKFTFPGWLQTTGSFPCVLTNIAVTLSHSLETRANKALIASGERIAQWEMSCSGTMKL